MLFFEFQQLFLSFIIILCGPSLSFTKPFSQKVSFRQNHPLVHQLQHEDSQSDVLQPEEGIDENIEESPIRHASHNRTNGDTSNPCFHFTERTWDSRNMSTRPIVMVRTLPVIERWIEVIVTPPVK